VKEMQGDQEDRFKKEIERRLKMKSLQNRILTVVAVGLLSIGFGASASQAQAVYKGSFTLGHGDRPGRHSVPVADRCC
jgi:hypothetical protein